MLILTRRTGEALTIGDDVTVTVLGNVVTIDDVGVSADHILITVVGT